MAGRRGRTYTGFMNRAIPLVALVVLVTFGAYTAWLTATDGYTGFLILAGREPWALQMLLDVSIACLLYSLWLVPDARRHGISPWPYLALTLVAGSLGGLVYLVRRGLVARQSLPAAG